ncbi:hypothetical protein LCGC14_1758860 [marine sediment metagenome]|uniref:Uncharacterized protein n=1 Tax=marine sediment metagenome TaxID=412755 RepID=A0A0F9H1P9_9ZZZZ
MTKYVTTEEQLQCMSCEIHCTQRELVDGKRCPNCHTDFSTIVLNVINGRLEYIRKVTGRLNNNDFPAESLDEILRGEI